MNYKEEIIKLLDDADEFWLRVIYAYVKALLKKYD